MYTVGLTGGIASGKNAATDMFAELGVEIIDADIIAREIVEPGQPALKEIEATFGPEAICEDGSMNRPFMRELVFSDDDKRDMLNAITHKRIIETMFHRAEVSQSPYCILSVAILIEIGVADLVDRVIVVDIPEQMQIERVMARDNQTEEQARNILKAQLPRLERLARADDVLDNTSTLDELRKRVEGAHQQYLLFAKAKNASEK